MTALLRGKWYSESFNMLVESPTFKAIKDCIKHSIPIDDVQLVEVRATSNNTLAEIFVKISVSDGRERVIKLVFTRVRNTINGDKYNPVALLL